MEIDLREGKEGGIEYTLKKLKLLSGCLTQEVKLFVDKTLSIIKNDSKTT